MVVSRPASACRPSTAASTSSPVARAVEPPPTPTVLRRPQRPASAPTQRPQAGGRRPVAREVPLEDEVHPPPLTELPWHLATPLERQFAKAVGMPEGSAALRLPSEVEACKLGGRCCWRWLARAAMERSFDSPVSHLGLGDAVREVRRDVKYMRDNFNAGKELTSVRLQAQKDAERLTAASNRLQVLETEVRELRETEDRYAKLILEKEELQADNERHMATKRGLEKVVACLQSQQRSLIEGDLATAKCRAEEAEAKLARIELEREQFTRQLASDVQEMDLQKATIARLHKQAEARRVRRKSNGRSPASRRAMTATGVRRR
mmetsp:Transcript_98149/g.246112  ORF Transcript_98149/g.246112 Transcript_98149/m.246112 type:complete len:321 (+) Transcript_98149:54-1016(+)